MVWKVSQLHSTPFERKWRGSPFAPWIGHALHDYMHDNRPINIWKPTDSYTYRIIRSGHVGLLLGGVIGLYQLSMEPTFTRLPAKKEAYRIFLMPITYKIMGNAIFCSLLMSTAWTLTASISNDVITAPFKTTTFDYFMAGIAATTVAWAWNGGSHGRFTFYCVLLIPTNSAVLRHLMIINEYTNDRAGIIGGNMHGPEQHTPKQMYKLYHSHPMPGPQQYDKLDYFEWDQPEPDMSWLYYKDRKIEEGVKKSKTMI